MAGGHSIYNFNRYLERKTNKQTKPNNVYPYPETLNTTSVIA